MKTEREEKLKSVIFKTLYGYAYLDMNEIVYFEAIGHCCDAYTTTSKDPIKILHTISFIEETYCPVQLCKCHRSFIVNLSHLKELSIKENKLVLINNMKVPISNSYVNLFKGMSRKLPAKFKNTYLDEFWGLIRFDPKKFYRKLLNFLIYVLLILTPFNLSKCESDQRYYRPDLPEVLSCVSVIDMDGTTHYIAALPEFLDNRYSTRYISIEKSFQGEYQKDAGDSLRDFQFKIYTAKGDVFNYKSDKAIKNRNYFPIPDSIKFNTEVEYFLWAKERDTPEIIASITAPSPAPEINFISVHKELIALTQPIDGFSLEEVDTLKSAELSFSFVNNGAENYYAVILVSRYHQTGIGFDWSGFLNFDIRKSNTNGFFAELQDLKIKDITRNSPGSIGSFRTPVKAYFIKGTDKPNENIIITLSTKFHGPNSVNSVMPETYSSLRIKLLSISKEMYLFEKSLYTYSEVKNDPFAEPVYLNGNIIGGNGIFAICRSSDLTVSLSPPY